METESSVVCSPEPVTVPQPESDESSSSLHNLLTNIREILFYPPKRWLLLKIYYQTVTYISHFFHVRIICFPLF